MNKSTAPPLQSSTLRAIIIIATPNALTDGDSWHGLSVGINLVEFWNLLNGGA